MVVQAPVTPGHMQVPLHGPQLAQHQHLWGHHNDEKDQFQYSIRAQ